MTKCNCLNCSYKSLHIFLWLWIVFILWMNDRLVIIVSISNSRAAIQRMHEWGKFNDLPPHHMIAVAHADLLTYKQQQSRSTTHTQTVFAMRAILPLDAFCWGVRAQPRRRLFKWISAEATDRTGFFAGWWRDLIPSRNVISQPTYIYIYVFEFCRA